MLSLPEALEDVLSAALELWEPEVLTEALCDDEAASPEFPCDEPVPELEP